MNAYKRQIDSLVRKVRGWRNRGGRHCPANIVAEILRLEKSWDADLQRRLQQVEKIFDEERRRRCETLGKLIAEMERE